MRRNSPVSGTLVAAGAALTATYAETGGIINAQGREQIIVLVNYTKGDETNLKMKVDYLTGNVSSSDRYQDSVGTTVSGVTTVSQREFAFTATGKYAIQIDSYDLNFVVSFKATAGTPTGTFGALYRAFTENE